MIEVLEMQDEQVMGFRVDGKIEKSDLQSVFTLFEEKVDKKGKMKFYMEIKDFGINDLSTEALKEDIKFWLKHPGMIMNFAKVALVTDSKWIENMFKIECALIPTLEGESFSADEKDKAFEWLETDQRAESNMDITFSELAETSTLKFASGYALGLLTAGLFSKKQRQNVGTALMFGALAAGIPLGIKVLNNNRQLLGARDSRKNNV